MYSESVLFTITQSQYGIVRKFIPLFARTPMLYNLVATDAVL